MDLNIEQQYADFGLNRTQFLKSLRQEVRNNPAFAFERTPLTSAFVSDISTYIFQKMEGTGDHVVKCLWNYRSTLKKPTTNLTVSFLVNYKVMRNAASIQKIASKNVMGITPEDMKQLILKEDPSPWPSVRVFLAVQHLVETSPMLARYRVPKPPALEEAGVELLDRIKPLLPEERFRAALGRFLDNYTAEH